jgi:hypothetical protein
MIRTRRAAFAQSAQRFSEEIMLKQDLKRDMSSRFTLQRWHTIPLAWQAPATLS